MLADYSEKPYELTDMIPETLVTQADLAVEAVQAKRTKNH